MNVQTKRLLEILHLEITFYALQMEEVNEFFDELSAWGAHSASRPLDTRTRITFLLKHLDSKEIDLNTYKKQLVFLDKRFEEIKKIKARYYEKVLKELKELVRSYSIHVTNIKTITADFENFLNIRNSCEIIVRELEANGYKKKLNELKQKIEEADEIFKQNAEFIAEKFKGFYTGEWDYYPKNFWWRHLKPKGEQQ
ncbi:MAG: hypothetical protein V1494_05925 [Candidatus Diapherotrites archaeon]